MDTNDSFVVFYSNFCDHSKEFLIKLKNLKNGLYEKFTKICVDNNQSIPVAIKSVPTILVPSHQYPLTDNSVFLWLDSMSSQYASEPVQNTQSLSSNGNPGNPGNPGNQVKSDENEDVTPYVAGEMGSSFSDSFSFLDADPQGGQPLAHTFTFIENGDPQISGQTNTNEIDRPNVTNSQKSTSGFDVAYEQYMSSRDADPFISQTPKRCG